MLELMHFFIFRVTLGHLAKKVLAIFQDNCEQKYQAALSAHGTRMR